MKDFSMADFEADLKLYNSLVFIDEMIPCAVIVSSGAYSAPYVTVCELDLDYAEVDPRDVGPVRYQTFEENVVDLVDQLEEFATRTDPTEREVEDYITSGDKLFVFEDSVYPHLAAIKNRLELDSRFTPDMLEA